MLYFCVIHLQGRNDAKTYDWISHSFCLSYQIFHKLKNLSNSDIDNIDVWVGGLLETSKSGPGELFSAVIEDQFRRIRDADRLWFENTYNGYEI